MITRGLAEMARIGVAYGASPLTFSGLAGVGDLFLTCSSSKSRNYTVGYRLGKGEPLQEILDTLGSVAEGVPTVKGAKVLVDKLAIDMPIINGVCLCFFFFSSFAFLLIVFLISVQIYKVLYEGQTVSDAVKELMSRPQSRELQLGSESDAGPAKILRQKLDLES